MSYRKLRRIVLLAGILAASNSVFVTAADPPLGKLPPGVSAVRSIEVSSAQMKAIGDSLGGQITRLANTFLQVHGRPIRVNTIVAADEPGAVAIHANLAKTKPFPFCLRQGKLVVEYVGRDLDPALAIKTSYELGFLPKPFKVRYRVTAELATVQQADYMACNPLFVQMLKTPPNADQAARQTLDELAKRFQFGRHITLRGTKLDMAATHSFQPAAIASKEDGPCITYSFDQLPRRHSVPYVTAILETTSDGSGFREDLSAPLPSLTTATRYWPSDDPEVMALARRITEGKSTNGAKVLALVEWLTPGKNLQYSGETGSRWGTAKVLSQKYGHCWDFSDCFVTLARASGVPCRQVAGWFYGSSGHVWAEFYREGKGWQQVDPTGGGIIRCGIYHIAYFNTDDGEMPIVYVAMPRIDVLTTQASSR